MLIYLRSLHTGQVFYLLHRSNFIIGRRDCDLLIENDKSISKHHAMITVKGDSVFIQDLGSTYKTLVGGKRISPDQEVPLRDGDEVKFGVFRSVYRLEARDYTVCCSGVGAAAKAKLRENLSKLSVRYSADWTPGCTHLAVSEVNLTIKLLLALLDERPVVRVEYWERFVESVDASTKPPKAEDYGDPPIAEPLLKKISLEANPARRRLFAGKVFLFHSEAVRRQMEDVISKAGGSSISLERDRPDPAGLPPDVVAIQMPASGRGDDAAASMGRYVRPGRRLVGFDEIAHAVVNGSCDRFCNPDFQLGRRVFCEPGPGEPAQAAPLAAETQAQDEAGDARRRADEGLDGSIEEAEVKAERPAKRMKLFDEGLRREERPADDVTTSLGKPPASPQAQAAPPKKPPPASQKRKSEDPGDTPFAFFCKKAKSRPEQRRNRETRSVVPEPARDRPDSPPKFDTTGRTEDVSTDTVGVVSVDSNETWLMKNSPSIKTEESHDDDDDGLDEDTRNFIRNMSIVLRICDAGDRTRNVEEEEEVGAMQSRNASGVTNYKRFKKVKPLNVRRAVLERGQLVLANNV